MFILRGFVALLVVVASLLPLTHLAFAELDSGQLEKLVRQLNADAAEVRDQAEEALFDQAPLNDADACDAYLNALPKPLDGMPPEVKLRLARLRKRIETEQSARALSESKFSLSADGMSLADVFQTIGSQTGNMLSDHREQFGQNPTPRSVMLELNETPFWQGLDKLLDATEMTIYPFSGEDTLAVIDREPGALPRAKGASYAGPFRIQATSVTSRRDLRVQGQEGTRIELEIAWEPRLRPIALSQAIDSLTVTAEDNSIIDVDSRQATLDVEVQPGSHATELTLPLALPSRNISAIASLKGQMSALVPGRLIEFKFEELDKPQSSTQARGGMTVTLQGMRQNQDLWEVHMRIKVESAETGLESHRGWIFQNLSYLLNEQGEVIDNAGFETTMQTANEVGFAYLFELPDVTAPQDLGKYTWVYRTPAAIVRVPVEFELKNIPLP